MSIGMERMALGFGALLILAALALFFLENDEPRLIRELKVESTGEISREEVLLRSQLKEGDAVRPGDIERARRKLEKLARVKEARFRWEESGALRVSIRERRCAALVRPLPGGRIFEVDESLRVLARDVPSCSDLPLFSGPFQRRDDTFGDSRLRSLLGLWAELKRSYPILEKRISEVRLKRGGGMILYLAGARLRVEASEPFRFRDAHRLYASLAYLESQGAFSGGKLDLRGTDAVFAP